MSTNCHANMINQINSPFTDCSTGRSVRSPRDVPFRSWYAQTHTISSTRTRGTFFGTPDTRSHPIIIIKGANNATRLRSIFAVTPSLNTVKNRCRAFPSTHYKSRAIILDTLNVRSLAIFVYLWLKDAKDADVRRSA